jgi:serine protease AprX
MTVYISEPKRSVSWGDKATKLLLAAVLLLPMLYMTPTTMNDAKVQPALLTLASEQPDSTVEVIVQMAGSAAEAEELISSLGGAITKELHVINAIAGYLPARAVKSLADLAGVRWVTLDGAVESNAWYDRSCDDCPPNQFLDTMGVRPLWDLGINGSGVGVAIIDSGVHKDFDFGYWGSRVTAQLSFADEMSTIDYSNGHGTHVAGIVAGDGSGSHGFYKGVAPRANMYSLRVSDANGMSQESDVVEAMQWVYDNRDSTNIRVVNLSINATTEQSYHASPIDAAAEILWFNGFVVVASAGNHAADAGYNTITAAPANDPFIITVGASHEQGTADPADDTVANFSSFGATSDGFAKPDIIAPGKDIISVLPYWSDWDDLYPERSVRNGQYFRLSGTSMSAPMVTGAVALMLQAQPDLTPDQVKYRLTQTGRMIAGRDGDPNSYPYLDVYSAVTGSSTETANTGIEASQLLWSGDQPVAWDSVSWNSVSWNSVSWNSVSWNSVSWNSVSWNSVSWND